eukprot:5368734-Amphidinium_carterae.1
MPLKPKDYRPTVFNYRPLAAGICVLRQSMLLLVKICQNHCVPRPFLEQGEQKSIRMTPVELSVEEFLLEWALTG